MSWSWPSFVLGMLAGVVVLAFVLFAAARVLRGMIARDGEAHALPTEAPPPEVEAWIKAALEDPPAVPPIGLERKEQR